MEFEAVVPYGSGKAWYRISKENPGIYCASLLNFDPEGEPYPPSEITLIRGIRSWKGSENDETLINLLGQLIETNFAAPFRKNRFR
jgi:hypothetical protein